MNSKYKMILIESKKLNGTGLLQKANANNITADKILYEYAIQMVSFQILPLRMCLSPTSCGLAKTRYL